MGDTLEWVSFARHSEPTKKKPGQKKRKLSDKAKEDVGLEGYATDVPIAVIFSSFICPFTPPSWVMPVHKYSTLCSDDDRKPAHESSRYGKLCQSGAASRIMIPSKLVSPKWGEKNGRPVWSRNAREVLHEIHRLPSPTRPLRYTRVSAPAMILHSTPGERCGWRDVSAPMESWFPSMGYTKFEVYRFGKMRLCWIFFREFICFSRRLA